MATPWSTSRTSSRRVGGAPPSAHTAARTAAVARVMLVLLVSSVGARGPPDHTRAGTSLASSRRGGAPMRRAALTLASLTPGGLSLASSGWTQESRPLHVDGATIDVTI